jgi:tetratricopeptide (TPR) repeat protein
VAEAQRLVDRAIAIQRSTGAESLAVAYAWYSLGRVRIAAGDALGARPGFARAAELAAKLGGPEHDLVAEALNGLSECALRLGDAPGALSQARRALEIDEKVFGKESANLTRDLTAEGEALLALRRPALAVPPLERGARLAEAGLLEPVERGAVRFALARALRAAGRDPGRGLLLARGALADFSAAEGPAARRAEDVAHWLGATPPRR